MSRHEVKRFVYMCDGLIAHNQRCDGVTVIDATNEKEADHLARLQGWYVDHNRKGVRCKGQHLKYSRTCDIPPTNPTDWVEGKTA